MTPSEEGPMAGDGFDCLAPETTTDGLPLYVPVERVDTLVRCQACGAVVEGDVVGQQQHNVWHRSLESKVRRAWMPPRYA